MTPVLRNRLWLAAALALTAWKLWLTRGQGVYVIGSAAHDDRLFVELAQHLVRGDWLGPYTEFTLAKGPFYPLFIAACFLAGLPLFLAQHAFYAAACGAFVQALRPAIASAGARFALYAFLLWNPMTYDAPSMGRVLRQQVYGPLALFILAGLVALYFRRAEPARRQWPWAVLAGAAAGCFYLTREEVVWFAPSAALLAGAVLFGAWRLARATALRSAALLALGLGVAAAPVFTVSALNLRHYGWFGTCEFRAAEFRDAYGAMLRVRVGPELPFVPVTREAREAMARESPRFALLQRQFEEGGLGLSWAAASEFLTQLPKEQGQIGGGWLMWAVREAAARAGQHGDARQALAFYRGLADELNRAGDAGRLPAGPRRSGFVPPWRAGQTPAFVRATREFADFVIRFSRFGGNPPASTGTGEQLQLFRDLTRERLSPAEGQNDVVGARMYMLNLWKADLLHGTGKALRPVLLVLFWTAQVLVLLRVGWLLLQRRWTYPLTVAAAAWGGCAASILMHAVIEASSFPVLAIGSFAPIYPLVLVFIAAVFWDALAALAGWRRADRLNPLDEPRLVGDDSPHQGGTPPADQNPPAARYQRLLPWLGGGLALLPFLVWHRFFRELFWFGDDLFLLDQMAQMGVGPWIREVFAESFNPLFKGAWAAAVFGLDGSYAGMLGLLWLTHAANTFLLGRLLLRAGLSPGIALATLAVFGLSSTNIESLGWAVIWSGLLATSFLLLGIVVLQSDKQAAGWRGPVLLALCAAGSAGSFVRGVGTGPALALGLLLPIAFSADWRTLVRRVPGALLCLIPAVAVAAVIKLNSSGLHQDLGRNHGMMIEYGLSYFLLNPWHALTGGHLHPAALLSVAAAKVGLVAAGLLFSQGPLRALLIVLLAYDLGNALLLGIGRHDAGFLSAMSSRYQYSSLLATLPFAGVVLDHVLARLPAARLRPGIALAVAAVAAALCLRGWPAALREFTGWRGTELRALIAAPPTSDPAVRVPALEFMHIERAKALQRAYHLH